MEWSSALTFWLVSAAFVFTPGADWAFAISAGVRRKAVLPAVGGLLSGHLVATVLVTSGLGAFFAGRELALSLLTVAGACYLVFLGVTVLRNPTNPEVGGADRPVDGARTFVKGCGVSLLNPKVLMLFVALFPQFADESAQWPFELQMLALGCIHVATCAVVYFAVAFGAGTLLAGRPRAGRIVSTVSGLIMTILGVVLIAEGLAKVV